MNFKITNIIINNQQIYNENILNKLLNNKMKDFINHILHDIRIPINNIQLSADLITTEIKNNKNIDEIINNIKYSLTFMMTTINNTINYNKISSNIIDTTEIMFDIKDLINNISKTIYYQLLDKKITLIIDIKNLSQTIILADQYKIEHILVNLLNNAIKFTFPNTDIIIRILSKYKEQRNISSKNIKIINEVQEIYDYTFEIIDNGHGISKENIEKIFNEFTQINNSDKTTGFGIGLSIVKKYVSELNGTINCTSEIGKGATFYFIIPIKINKTSVINNSIRNSSVKFITKEKIFEENELLIAIIDDTESNCKILQRIFKNMTIDTDIYLDGNILLEEKDKINNYSFMIIDYYMNTINGPDLTKKLRENNYNNIIIGLTGTVIKEDIDNFLNSGANIILQKPLDIKVIKSIIHFITYNGYYSDIFNEIYDKIDNKFV